MFTQESFILLIENNKDNLDESSYRKKEGWISVPHQWGNYSKLVFTASIVGLDACSLKGFAQLSLATFPS
jgi:hypothetical protein